MNILFAAAVDEPQRWLDLLREALRGDELLLPDELVEASAIDIALVAKPPPGLLARLSRLRLIQSLWMGVDGLLADPTLPAAVPLARCVDPGLTSAMAETALAHVLDHHRHLYRYRAQQVARSWRQLPQARADDRTVGVLGLGELGRATAVRLRGAGFHVLGWGRRARVLEGVSTFAGPDGLLAVLPRCDVIVCLLPLTAQTRGVLNAAAFASMKRGAGLINLARGAHVVEADLLAALAGGQLAHAWLDVFEAEPLPPTHPFWAHPDVTVTPHVAALTDPRSAAPMIVANIERVRRGEVPLHLVDRAAGY